MLRTFLLLLATLFLAAPADSEAYPGAPYPERGGGEGGGQLGPAFRPVYWDLMTYWGFDEPYDWSNVLIPTDIRENHTEKDATNCTSDQLCEADRDGDTLVDYILCGDFDGDGELVMDGGCTDPGEDGCDSDGDKNDVLACLERLDDTDGGPDGYRVLEILAGRYTVPAEPWTAHNGTPSGGDGGILEPGSNTVIRCRPGTTLVGSGLEHDDTADVIGTIFVGPTVSNVHIDGCEIDGAYPDQTFPLEDRVADCSVVDCVNAGFSRPGVFIRGATNVTVSNTYVHHVHHSCFYASGYTGLDMRNNRAEWCGGSWDSSGTETTWPGFYAYQGTNGVAARNTLIENFECRKIAGGCINTRASVEATAPPEGIVDLKVHGMRFTDDGSGIPFGTIGTCSNLRGIKGLELFDIYCNKVRGVAVVAASYPAALEPGPYITDPEALQCLDGPDQGNACATDTDCSGAGACNAGANGCCGWDADGGGANLALSDVHMKRVIIDNYLSNAIGLGSYTDGLVLEDVYINGRDGTGQLHGITGFGPYRGLRMERVSVLNTARNGINLGNVTQSEVVGWGQADSREAIHLKQVSVDTVDDDTTDATEWHGIALGAGCVGCLFEQIAVRGTNGMGWIVLQGPYSENTHRDIAIDQMPDPLESRWFKGVLNVADLPTCDSSTDGDAYWVLDANSASDCSVGAGNRPNFCICADPTWTDANVLGSIPGNWYGMDFTALGNAMDDNVFQDVFVHGYGINQRHMIELPDNAGSTGNSFTRVFCGETKGYETGLDDAAGCIDFHSSTGTWTNVECDLLFNNGTANRRCVCEDGSCSTGSSF